MPAKSYEKAPGKGAFFKPIFMEAKNFSEERKLVYRVLSFDGDPIEIEAENDVYFEMLLCEVLVASGTYKRGDRVTFRVQLHDEDGHFMMGVSSVITYPYSKGGAGVFARECLCNSA